MRRRDLFHADRPETCEACRATRLHTEDELYAHHADYGAAARAGSATQQSEPSPPTGAPAREEEL